MLFIVQVIAFYASEHKKITQAHFSSCFLLNTNQLLRWEMLKLSEADKSHQPFILWHSTQEYFIF